jgi:hypothetical protein
MRPLSPDERAEILARHPGATEADIERYDALLSRRRTLARESIADETAPARLAAVELELADMEARVFPAWDDAITAVAARRVAADDAQDDGISVS